MRFTFVIIVECPDNCEACTVRDGAVYCTTCDSKFALIDDGKCRGYYRF